MHIVHLLKRTVNQWWVVKETGVVTGDSMLMGSGAVWNDSGDLVD